MLCHTYKLHVGHTRTRWSEEAFLSDEYPMKPESVG